MTERDENQPSSANDDWRAAVTRAMHDFASYLAVKNDRERSEATWRKLRRGLLLGLVLGAFLAYGMFIRSLPAVNPGDAEPSATGDTAALIPVQGEIAGDTRASADKVLGMLDRACADAKVKVIALYVNSPGGSPTESERIISGIRACKAKHPKPVISVIDQLGASAAYMIALHTDKIYAGRYTIVGSVGAIMRYVDASEAVTKLGLTERVFRSGELKGGVSPWSKLSAGDAAVNEEIVTKMGGAFLDDVVATRGKRLKADRALLATGRIWTSQDALDLGLIDGIAVIEDLKDTEFKGLRISRYDSRPAVSKLLGLDLNEVAHTFAADLLQPRFE